MFEDCQHDNVTVVTSKTWPFSSNDRATAISSTVVKVQGQNQSFSWTTEQAFFAICGGFVVKSDSFYPTERLTFTAQGLLELAKTGLLPSIAQEDVQDKSKANTVGKVITCFQAGWFLIQSIARVQQGLPLTLLELHTVTHILCAFCLYGVWWKKPYDVENPIFCTDDRILDMAALLALEPFEDRGLMRHAARKCGQRDIIGLESVRMAHQYPLTHSVSWYFGAAPNLRSWKNKPRHINEKKVLEHLKRANRALSRLRVQGSHFNWIEYQGTCCTTLRG